MPISKIEMYLLNKKDDSYTPSKIAIKAGTSYHDLQEVRQVDLTNPNGWIEMRLGISADAEAGEDVEEDPEQ